MLDFFYRISHLSDMVSQARYNAKCAEVDHLLTQRDKIAAQRDALAKELEIRTTLCGNAMREVERLKAELHTYEMVSTPPLKPPTRKRQQKTQENK